MNAIRSYLIPAVLVPAALWLGWKETQRSGVTAETRPPLSKASPRELRDAREPKNSRTISKGVRHDWDNLAKDLSLRKYSPLPENPSLRVAIDGMSVEELIAAIANLKDSGLSDDDRAALERELAKTILLRSPERGFSLFGERARGDWDFFLGLEFSDWVGRDKDAAVAWLGSHSAAGGYVAEQMIRQAFFDFLVSDPQTSSSILATRPLELRLESLGGLAMRELRHSGQQEWAQVVRSQLPAATVPEAISWPIKAWSDGDGSPMTLDEVDAYMEHIHVTDEERKACILTAARQARNWVQFAVDVDGEPSAFNRMLAWVQRHDPEMLWPATLAGMQEVANCSNFEEAGSLAIQFHNENADDAYLTMVLELVDDQSEPKLLREVIGRLSDPALREKHQAEQAHRLK